MLATDIDCHRSQLGVEFGWRSKDFGVYLYFILFKSIDFFILFKSIDFYLEFHSVYSDNIMCTNTIDVIILVFY